MALYIDYDWQYGVWEITQSGGQGVLTTAEMRDEAVRIAQERYADDGEKITVRVEGDSDEVFYGGQSGGQSNTSGDLFGEGGGGGGLFGEGGGGGGLFGGW